VGIAQIFTELKKIVGLSKPSLSEKLQILKEKELIYKEGKRTQKYQLNRLVFDRSPLYPAVVAALCFGGFSQSVYLHLKEISENNEIDKQKAISEAIDRIEKDIGRLVLNTLILQSQKDINGIEILNKFIRFISIFIAKKDYFSKLVNQTSDIKELEKFLSIPYSDLEGN